MYRIDPERLDLFEEFKAKPFGPYSHELERLLNRLRMGPVKGGNGFNWRVAYHPTRPGVIELRRAEDGARYWAEEPGESWLEWSAEYGGLWRRVGSAPNTLVGIGTRATGFDRLS